MGSAGALGAVLLGHVTVDGSLGLLAVLLPDLQQRFALSTTALAGLVALLSLSSSVTQPVLGHLADRTGVRHAATAGTLMASALLLLAVAPHPLVAVAAVALGGLGAGTFHPAAATLVQRASRRRAESAIGVFSAAGMLGLAVVPMGVLALLRAGQRALVPALLAAAVVAAGLVWARTGAAAPSTTGSAGEGSGSTADGGAHVPAPAGGRGELLRGPVGRLALAAALSHVAWSTYLGVTPLLVADALGATDSSWIGWTLGAFNVAAALGGVVAGWVVVRAGRATVVGASLVAAVPGLLASLLVAPGSPAALLAAAVAGAGLHASLPVLAVVAQQLAPRRPSAAAGMIFGLAVGGGGLLYLPVGWLQSQVGVRPAAAAAYLLVLPAAALAVRTLRRVADRAPAAAPAPAPITAACGCPTAAAA